jgi:hypothetical protein
VPPAEVRWVSWLRSLSWAAWPRTFVTGLFDIPDVDPPIPTLVPAPDWLRTLSLEGEPLFLTPRALVHRRTLDLRRGILLIEWHQRDPAGGSSACAPSDSCRWPTERWAQLARIEVDQRQIPLEAWLEPLGAGRSPGGTSNRRCGARLGQRLASPALRPSGRGVTLRARSMGTEADVDLQGARDQQPSGDGGWRAMRSDPAMGRAPPMRGG